MILRWVITSCLLLTPAARASITVAWKVPLTQIGADAAALRTLDRPPGPSAFFQAGDALRDLSGPIAERIHQRSQPSPAKPWSGDWIVWDERAGLIVAHGTWNDLLEAEACLDLDRRPIILRAQVQVAKGADRRELHAVTQSGSSASVATKDLDFSWAPVCSSAASSLKFSTTLRWTGGASTWTASTTAMLEDGAPLRIAVADGWEITLQADFEYPDGARCRQASMVESSGTIQFRQPGRIRLLSEKIDATRTLVAYQDTHSPHDKVHLGSAVEIPSDLKIYLGGELLDYHDTAVEQFFLPSDTADFFSAYDPRTSRIFVVADEKILKQCDACFDNQIRSPPLLSIETNEAAGSWTLCCQSDEKASLVRTTAGAEDLRFQIDPVLSGAVYLVDLRYIVTPWSASKLHGRLDSTTTLIPDQPAEIGSYSPAGPDTRMLFTARTLNFSKR